MDLPSLIVIAHIRIGKMDRVQQVGRIKNSARYHFNRKVVRAFLICEWSYVFSPLGGFAPNPKWALLPFDDEGLWQLFLFDHVTFPLHVACSLSEIVLKKQRL